MTANRYFDNDADLSVLNDKVVAVLGYGNQGRAHALNLRESGCNVTVGQRSGSDNHARAIEEGFAPVGLSEAVAQADVISILLPDETAPAAFESEVRCVLREGQLLLCAHGFNIHYQQIVPPDGVDIALVAPKGPGNLVRAAYERGSGVPGLMALTPGASAGSRERALAYAKGIGCTRAGVLETTFAEETETDLFGEQVVLCGGVSALTKAAFETLVEAGYQPEMAYIECIHELKQVVDLQYEGGLAWMRHCISNTAEFGDYTRGPRIVTDETRAEMKRILAEIRNGDFAREWIQENRQGCEAFHKTRADETRHPSEPIGQSLRAMFRGEKSD